MSSSVQSIVVYGPAYLDVVLRIPSPLLDDSSACLDQSLPAARMVPATDGAIRLSGPTGDRMTFLLPPEHHFAAAGYDLCEPVLARLRGAETSTTIQRDYQVTSYGTQVGGMGAGYALACDGTLRMPLGATHNHPDTTGLAVLQFLTTHGVRTLPALLPDCPSDTSLVLLTPRGDKLAVGVRQAMMQWRATPEDRALVEQADVLIFCGAPNALVADVLAWRPHGIVMCAPAMRNVTDRDVPLAAVADLGVQYLALNALEWAHTAEHDAVRARVPLISITDGPRGSRVLMGQAEFATPADDHVGPANTNRAGETYASTFLKVLLRHDPAALRQGTVGLDLARLAARVATRQATRQLGIDGFAFPTDDWIDHGTVSCA